jgi:hypothetical protein
LTRITATNFVPSELEAIQLKLKGIVASPFVAVQLPPKSLLLNIFPVVSVLPVLHATKFFPDASDAIENQFAVTRPAGTTGFHVAPESVLVYIPPFCMTAAKFVPVESDATDFQLVVIAGVLVQLIPESMLVHIPPVVAPVEHTTNFFPNASDAIEVQVAVTEKAAASTQVPPESVLVYILPPLMPATKFVPSELEAIQAQFPVIADVLVQLFPALVLLHIPPVLVIPEHATIFCPSELMAILLQRLVANPDLVVQVVPESVLTNNENGEVPAIPTTNVFPSLLEATQL